MKSNYKHTPKTICLDLVMLCDKRMYDLQQSMKMIQEFILLLNNNADSFDSEESFIFQANNSPFDQPIHQFLASVTQSSHSMKFEELLDLIMTTDHKTTLQAADELRKPFTAFDVIFEEYWRRREAEEANVEEV